MRAEMWGGPIDGVTLELETMVELVRVKALGKIEMYQVTGICRRQAVVYRIVKEVGSGREV